MLSSVDGCPVAAGLDLRRHLAAQVTARVEFEAMVRRMAAGCDLLIEVGPGAVLTGLVPGIVGPQGPPCLPVASRPESADRDLVTVLARAFVLGADIRWGRLYDGRLVRPYVPASERLFLDNPCERPFPEVECEPLPGDGTSTSLEAALADSVGVTPDRIRAYLDRRRKFLVEVVRADLNCLDDAAGSATLVPQAPTSRPPDLPAGRVAAPAADLGRLDGPDLEAVLLDLAAERTGFPRTSLTPDVRLLDDLNLDSIKAAELVAVAARSAEVAGRLDPAALANASLSEIATAIRRVLGDDLPPVMPAAVRSSPSSPEPVRHILDAGPSWVRHFVVEYVPEAA